MARRWCAAAALLLAGALAGCGGGGGGASSGGGAMTPEARVAVLDDIKAQVAALPGTDRAADNQAILNYVRSRPEFASSGANDGGVWARFTDGELFMFFNDRDFTEDGRALPPPTSTGRATTVDLPGPKQARVINTFDPAADGRTDQIRQMLTANGYTSAGSDGTVDGLKHVQGDGVLYIDAHGNVNDDDPHPQLWMSTNTPYSAAAIRTYDADIKAFRVAYGVTKQRVRNPDGTVGDKDVPTGNLIISDAFASTYWKLGQNSFVFINACSSDYASFKNAAIKAGAGLYVGWTKPVLDATAAKTGRYLVDRLLGANTASPKEDPNQRPFDYVSLYSDLHARGLDSDGSATLVFTPGNSTFGLLAPSIRYMSVDEQKKELTITGTFGTDQSAAKITVGGSEVAIKQWGFNSVIADLPSGLAGDVIVTVNGHRSNAVPLTMWAGDITYTQTDTVSPFKVEVKTHVEFRADIHGHRDDPHTDPIYGIVPYEAEKDVSTCTYAASGIVYGNGGSGSLVGNGTVPLVSLTGGAPGGTPSSDSFYFFGSVDSKQKSLDINFSAQISHGITLVPQPVGPAAPFPVAVVPALFFLPDPPPTNASLTWTLPLGDDFNIADGELNKTVPGNGASGLLKLAWHFDPVQSAPDPSLGEDSEPTRAARRAR